MEDTGLKIAKALLRIKAVKIDVKQPFTWTSGSKSPVYCDNRKILSYPDVRKSVYEAFAEMIRYLYPDTEIVAGVATGAIAHGALAAEASGLPFVYVRTSPKEHGAGNIIEGDLTERAKTVVIEDLISTGGSSLAAVEALRNAGAEVSGLLAIFDYGLDTAAENFKKAGCKVDALCDWHTLIEEAVKSDYVDESEIEILRKWRESPTEFGKTQTSAI